LSVPAPMLCASCDGTEKARADAGLPRCGETSPYWADAFFISPAVTA
jgi:hypothetical protein